MANEKVIFMDYGELLFRYDFNKNTLSRAHNLVLEHLHNQGVDINKENLAKAHDTAIHAYLDARKKDNSEWTMGQIMSLMFDEAGLDYKHLDKVSTIYKLSDHDSTPFPSTITEVPKLAKIADLGIISNLPHDALVHELKRYEMFDFFKTITVSYQIGVRKPHQKIYQEALRRANVRADESLFISHEDYEVKGAEAVGMRGLLVPSLENILEVAK